MKNDKHARNEQTHAKRSLGFIFKYDCEMYFAERMPRKIRTTAHNPSQRNESHHRVLEIKSTHPHFKRKTSACFQPDKTMDKVSQKDEANAVSAIATGK